MPTPLRSSARRRALHSGPFALMHVLPFLAVFTGVTRRAVLVAVAFYILRIFCITAGYHRYFAHRTYRLARLPQFLLAFGGLTAAQKGPLWWAGQHRLHHRYADTDRDPHSPRDGFWWSHVGWILSDNSGPTDPSVIRDLAAYPELRFLDHHDWIGPWTLGVASYLIAGWSGLVIGFFASTVLVWHATFAVNSFAHLVGRRSYDTPDDSRNSAVIALITLGEGWHNNHHRTPTSARLGHQWWQLDPAYAVLRTLRAVGVVHDLRVTRPPQGPPPSQPRADVVDGKACSVN